MEAPFKTHGGLIRALLTLYQNAMDEGPEEPYRLYSFLHNRNLVSGICMASIFNFNYNIYNSQFVQEFTSGRGFLCETPSGFSQADMMIQALKARVDRLKDMLPAWDDTPIIVEYINESSNEHHIK